MKEVNKPKLDIGSVDHFGYLWPQKMPEVGISWLQKYPFSRNLWPQKLPVIDNLWLSLYCFVMIPLS
jgi:hypothetical protein